MPVPPAPLPRPQPYCTSGEADEAAPTDAPKSKPATPKLAPSVVYKRVVSHAFGPREGPPKSTSNTAASAAASTLRGHSPGFRGGARSPLDVREATLERHVPDCGDCEDVCWSECSCSCHGSDSEPDTVGGTSGAFPTPLRSMREGAAGAAAVDKAQSKATATRTATLSANASDSDDDDDDADEAEADCDDCNDLCWSECSCSCHDSDSEREHEGRDGQTTTAAAAEASLEEPLVQVVEEPEADPGTRRRAPPPPDPRTEVDKAYTHVMPAVPGGAWGRSVRRGLERRTDVSRAGVVVAYVAGAASPWLAHLHTVCRRASGH